MAPMSGEQAAGRVVEAARAAGLRLVRFLYCDLDGVVRGKASGIAGLGQRLESGIGLTVAMQAFTLLDRLAPVEGMGPVGEVRLLPDLDTFVVAPYAPHTGVVLADLATPALAAYDACARTFLHRMEERATAAGLRVMAAFEPEWTLCRPVAGSQPGWEPLDRSLCFSSYGMDSAQDVVDEVVGALEAQGLVVEQYYPELGWGQQELSIRHASALRAADHLVLYRETVRSVAHRHGLAASFAPKPWPDQPGNGCHLHFSLRGLEGEPSRFADASGAISQVARQFVAGVLEHLPGLMALTCASVNSYRRLIPQAWASAYRAWGYDNREAAVRVASPLKGQEAETANAELKACDASANPYLALGGLIAAGLDGVERRLEPPPPVTVDPHLLAEDERAAAGITRHPASLAEALERLEQDRVLREALGERLATTYRAVKEVDLQSFPADDPDLEYDAHRFRF
jgi:glutamine synthetase